MSITRLGNHFNPTSAIFSYYVSFAAEVLAIEHGGYDRCFRHIFNLRSVIRFLQAESCTTAEILRKMSKKVNF